MFSPGLTLGILGGGQLGKMLINEAMRWDLRIAVLDPAQDAPCFPYAHEFSQGDLTDFNSVLEFGRKCDLLTIEIEHVNVDALELLEAEGIPVRPSSRLIRIIQDKSIQKQTYLDLGIPTAPFTICQNVSEISKSISYPYVWKAAKDGYDGKGVKIIRKANDLIGLPPGPCLTEEFAGNMIEIAIIVSRNPSGEISVFPAVEMVFHPEANLVEWISCPASLSLGTMEKAEKIAVQVADGLKVEGIIAVEMFVLEDGRIWVNESAPRPHNSGHQTIEANFTSQYQQHLRAILDLPPGQTGARCPSIMLNLLGEPNYKGKPVYKGIEEVLEMDGIYVHLYGKVETRPFRKMGHITVLGNTKTEAETKAKQVRDSIKVIA